MCELGILPRRMCRQGEVIGAYAEAAKSAAAQQGLGEVFQRLESHGQVKEDGLYGNLHGQFLECTLRIEDPRTHKAEWASEDGFGFHGPQKYLECSPPFRPAVAAFAESIAQPRKKHASSRSRGPIPTTASKPMPDLINSLPDECLQEIFGYLPRAQDRCACAFVCMRWLLLQSRMHRHDFVTVAAKCQDHLHHKSECASSSGGLLLDSGKGHSKSKAVQGGGSQYLSEVQGSVPVVSGKDDPGSDKSRVERLPQGATSDLSRSLEGRKATDVQLAFTALGTLACGGLGKLSIEGGAMIKGSKGVSNDGLLAVGNCCAALRCLSLWDCLNVGDEGLAAIGNGCHLLERLDLLKCPKVGNAGVQAIAKGCPLLSTISVDSCTRVGDEGLMSVGKWCSALASLTISNCRLVGSQGIAAVGAGCKKIKMLKLERINVSDDGLAHLGKYCEVLFKLKLVNLKHCTEAGIIGLCKGVGLQQLRSLSIFACSGITDQSLEEIGKACRDLKLCVLSQCPMVTDDGLKAFVQCCACLESLQLESCHAITHAGLLGALTHCKGHLQMLGLSQCNGVQDQLPAEFQLTPLALKSLQITYCKGMGNGCIAVVGRCCSSLQHLDLSGLIDMTDATVMVILQASGRKLVSLNLSGCIKISNVSIRAVAKYCGKDLRSLGLDGCCNVNDHSLQLVAAACNSLEELDASQTAITDYGIGTLVASCGPWLQTLTLLGCRFLTDESLSLIEQYCPFLWALNVKHCPHLTHAALSKLKSHLWECELFCC